MTKRIWPQEAHELMQGDEGWRYIDVRSVMEFDRGHPAGAYNVPLFDFQPALGGMVPNPQFLSAMQHAFGPDARLIIGCQSGGRTARAAQVLVQHGFQHVIEQGAGWDGLTDGMGRLSQPGWQRVGLPVETAAPPERTWEGLRAGLQGKT